MPNDFEKRVRQKMDELDFVPGEPVWLKIEDQIRKKKEKRRAIFWMPVFVLLLGGAAYWLNQSNGINENSSKNEQPASIPATDASKTSHETKDAISNSKVTDTEKEKFEAKETGHPQTAGSTTIANPRITASVRNEKEVAVKNGTSDQQTTQNSKPVSTFEPNQNPGSNDKVGTMIL